MGYSRWHFCEVCWLVFIPTTWKGKRTHWVEVHRAKVNVLQGQLGIVVLARATIVLVVRAVGPVEKAFPAERDLTIQDQYQQQLERRLEARREAWSVYHMMRIKCLDIRRNIIRPGCNG